jgi:hypothetical protein
MKSHIIAAAWLAASAVGAAAQGVPPAGPDSLPRELVEALLRPYLGLYSGGASGFVVGHVPASLAPFFFVPPGARVLGGIETPTTTVVVLSVPMSVDDVRSAYRREQLRLGWTMPSPAGARGWGFVPAPGMGQDGTLTFCHIGQSIQIVPYQMSSQPLIVTATVQNYGTSCGTQIRFGMQASTAVELPLLMNPQDAGMNDRACLSSNLSLVGSNGTSERLQTKLSPTQLLEHFSRQLSDSGWSASPALAAVRRVWTRPDSGGAARELTLTITPSAVSGCQELSMQVRRVLSTPGR